MSHLSFSTIEKQLGWPDIRLERHEQTVDGQFNITNIVRVYPSQEQLPFIEFHFQGEFEFLCSLGFAEWHTHFDDTESVDEALELAKLLIERK